MIFGSNAFDTKDNSGIACNIFFNAWHWMDTGRIDRLFGFKQLKAGYTYYTPFFFLLFFHHHPRFSEHKHSATPIFTDHSRGKCKARVKGRLAAPRFLRTNCGFGIRNI